MLNAIAPLAKILFSTIEKSIPDKDLQAKLKADLQTQLMQSHTQELTAAAKIIEAEAAGEQKVDPLVALKQRELDLKAMDLQIKQSNIMTDNALNASQFKVDTLMTQQELEIKDRQSNDRLNIAKEKINLAREKQNKR